MKEILRKCIVTQKRLSKDEMIRIVKKDTTIQVDINQSIQGRGAYIQKDEAIIKKAQKRNVLSRVFRQEVDKEIYNSLLGVINE